MLPPIGFYNCYSCMITAQIWASQIQSYQVSGPSDAFFLCNDDSHLLFNTTRGDLADVPRNNTFLEPFMNSPASNTPWM